MRERKKFIAKNSPSYTILQSVVLNENTIKDLPYLAQFKHSGELEVFHSLYNVYCPKRISFSYEGMYARTQLAVMDHNSGVGRVQATTKTGEKKYKTVYSKVSSSWVAKKIMEDKNKTFIQDILQTIWEVTGKNLKGPVLEATPKNIAPIPNPGKSKVVKSPVSRFSS